MNQTPPEKIISPSLEATGKGFVAFHTGFPGMELLADFAGLDQPGPGWMLARIITLALSRAGLSDEAATFTGTLRDGICLVATRDPLQAVEIIKAELSAVCLLPVCQIGVYTAQRWLCVHPGPQTRLNWLLDSDRLALVTSAFVEKIKAIQKVIQQLPPPPAHS